MDMLFKSLKFWILWMVFHTTQFTWGQVSVSVNITPPFNPFLSNYTDLDFSRVNITFSNKTANPLDLTLKAKLKRVNDDYTIAETNVSSRPMGSSITLAPFETKTLSEFEVRGVFSASTLTYDRSLITKVATTGVIPEGSYSLCVIPYDNITLQPMSEEINCCSPDMNIQFSEPPQIISINTSECGQDVIGAKQLNSLVFTWSPTVVFGIQQPMYRFQLYELLNQTVNNDNQVFSGTPIIDIPNIQVPTLYINPNTYNLLNNTRYIFRVQVYDPNGMNVFQNEGYSQSCSFKMLPLEAPEDLPNGLTSNYGSSIAYPSNLDTLPFEWIPIVQKVSPKNNRLSEVSIFTQILKAGLSIDLGKTERFNRDDIQIVNPNNHYSIVADRLEASNSFYGNIYTINTASTFQNENYLLPGGNAQTQFYVSGMTSPIIRQVQNRGTQKNQFKLNFIPGRPPAKLLPDDRAYFIRNNSQNSSNEISVKQTLCLEILKSISDPLPQRIAYKNFNYTYDLSSVSESQILTDLYSEKTWDIDLPDSTLTLMRLVWLMDPEDTQSMAYRSSDIKMVNEDNIGTSLCVGVSNYDGLHPGDTVCIAGGIMLKVNNINATNPNGTYNGRGWVRIPVWDKKFMIDFKNLAVSAGGLVTGGTAEAVHSREDLVPKDLSVAQAQQLLALESNRNALFNIPEENTGNDTASRLPYRFQIPGTHSKLFLWKLVLAPENASAYMYYQIPMLGDTLEFASFGTSLSANCNNQSIMRLNLLSDYQVSLPGADGNQIIFKPNLANGSSYIQMGCGHIFQSGKLVGEFRLDESLFTPVEGESASDLVLPFDVNVDINGNFLGSLKTPKFHPGGVSYVEIDSNEFFFDFSATENHARVAPPIRGANATWQGFYAKNLQAKITQVFTPKTSNNQTEQRDTIKISVDQLSISETDGFNSQIFARNLIPYERGWDLGGWRYSLDTFNLEFKHGQIINGLASGRLKTPVDSGNRTTLMRLNLGQHSISGSLKLGNEFPFAPMSAALKVKNSDFQFDYATGKDVKLKLTVDVDFQAGILTETRDTLIHAQGEIQGLSFSNEKNKYFSIDNVVLDRISVLDYRMATGNTSRNGNGGNSNQGNNGSGGNSQSNGPNGNNNNASGNSGTNNGNAVIGDAEAAENQNKRALCEKEPWGNFENLPPIEFIKRKIGNDTRYEFHFRGSFETGGQDFLVMKGHGNWGFISRENGDIEPYVPELNEFGVKGSIGPVRLSGLVNIYYNDATYGKGFRGRLDASFDMMNGGLYIGLDYLSGKVSQLPYWYFLGEVELPVSVPISPGINWKGAGLQIGKNVEFNGVAGNLSVVPNRGGMIFGGKVTMSSPGTPGKETYKLKGGISASLSANFGLNRLIIDAELGIMGSKFPSEQPSNEFILNATGQVVIDLQNDQFSANVSANLYMPQPTDASKYLIKGGNGNNQVGQLSILFAPDRWHVMLGKPSNSLNVMASIWGMNLQFQTYYMLGTQLEPYQLPPVIRNAFPNLAMNATPSISNGVAHGASLKFATGKKEWLCFYGELDFLVGYDFSFGQAGACAGFPNPGYNGWYATGQMYGAGKVDVGIMVNTSFYEGPISIMNANSQALIQGGLPNPSYLQGGIRGQYSVLGGLISGSFYFDFSVGDYCVPELPPVETPVADLVLIQNLSPENNERKITIGVQPSAVFNFHHDEAFSIEVPSSDRNNPRPVIRTFKAMHFLTLRNRAQGNIAVNTTRRSNNGIHYMGLKTVSYLNPDTEYEVVARSYFEERNRSGIFARARKLDGSEVPEQNKIHRFRTEATATIQPYFIENQFPEPNRSFVYGNLSESKFIFERNTGGLFSTQSAVMTHRASQTAMRLSSAIEVKYLAKFTQIENGQIAVSDIQTQANRNFINFSMAGLPKGKLFRMDIIRVPAQCERYQNLTSTMNNLRFFDFSRYLDQEQNIMRQIQGLDDLQRNFMVEMKTMIDQNGNTSQIRQVNLNPMGNEDREASQARIIANSYEDIMYTTHFGTSRFNQLTEKINSTAADQRILINVQGVVPTLIINGSEPLCESDFDNPNNQESSRLVPISTNEYLVKLREVYETVNVLINQQILRPSMFENQGFVHYNAGRFTANQDNTYEILYPANPNGIVWSNAENTQVWNNRRNMEMTILRGSQNGRLDAIDRNFQQIQNLLSRVLAREFPVYQITNLRTIDPSRTGSPRVQNTNAPDAVRYDLLFNNTSDVNYLQMVQLLINIQNLNRQMSGNRNWGVRFFNEEAQYNRVFNANLPKEETSMGINIEGINMQEIIQNNTKKPGTPNETPRWFKP